MCAICRLPMPGLRVAGLGLWARGRFVVGLGDCRHLGSGTTNPWLSGVGCRP